MQYLLHGIVTAAVCWFFIYPELVIWMHDLHQIQSLLPH